MKAKKLYFLLGLLGVAILSFRLLPLRKMGYDYVPISESTDEIDNSLVGVSLRKTGKPMGWSIFEGRYREKGILASDMKGFSLLDKQGETADIGEILLYTTQLDLGKGPEHTTLIQPYADHPLLGSFLIGIGQIDNIEQINLTTSRKNLIATGVVTGILTYIFIWLLSGNALTGMIGWSIYTLSPSIFLSSRYAFLENMLIPFSLAAFCSLLVVEKTKSEKWKVITLLLAGVITGLAINVKEVGVYILITGVIYLLQTLKSKKKLWLYLLPAITVGSLSYLFHLLMLRGEYLSILLEQANRAYHGPLGLWKMITGLKFENFPIDGYWLYGVISLIVFSLRKNKKYLLLTISWWVYMVVMGLLGNEYYPWYGLALVPLVVAGGSLMVGELIKKPSWMNLILFLILPMSTSLFWGKYFIDSQINHSNHFRVTILLILILGYIFIKEKKLQGTKKWIWAAIVLGIFIRMGVLNIRGIQTYFQKYENIPTKWVVQ